MKALISAHPDCRGKRVAQGVYGRPIQKRQRGYIMVVSMLILLLVTIMSISMAKSFFLEEGMAANVREKQRSFQAAQAGLAYGEFIVRAYGTTGVSCAGTGKQTYVQICTNAYTSNSVNNTATTGTSSSVMPFTSYATVPASYWAGSSVTNTSAKDTYFAAPGVYVQFLSSITAPKNPRIYLVTAFGYGATQNSVSIVQSTFSLESNVSSPTSTLN